MPKLFLILFLVLFGSFCFVNLTQAGLVPCGRTLNDNQTSWDERDECTLCHFFLMGQRIFSYLLNFLAIITLLMGVVVGYLFFAGSFSPEAITNAKKALTTTLLGFAIVIIAWVVIFTVGHILGWTAENSWYLINCTA